VSTQPNSTSIDPQASYPDLNITDVCSCNSSECTDLDFRFFRKLGTFYPYLCYGTVAKGTSAKDRHNNGNIVVSNICYYFHVLAGYTSARLIENKIPRMSSRWDENSRLVLSHSIFIFSVTFFQAISILNCKHPSSFSASMGFNLLAWNQSLS
jgi:hypothetical protein